MPLEDLSPYPEAVAANNLKAFGDANTMPPTLAALSSAGHYQRLNHMQEISLGTLMHRMIAPDPVEAVATQKLMSGTDSLQYGQAIAAMAQMNKQTAITPPIYIDPSTLVNPGTK